MLLLLWAIVLKLNAGKVYCNFIWLLFFYRIGVIKLVCDEDQYPGKFDPFVEVEDATKTKGTYVSGV